MSAQNGGDSERPQKNKNNISILRIGGAAAVLTGVLFLGIGIGNGTIAVGYDSIYSRSGDQKTGDLSYEGIDELYRTLSARYDGKLDEQALEDGLKEGLVEAAGDPYTEYLTEDENREFNEQLNGSFEGIGAELSKDDKSIVIIAPIDGFPAEKAGLRAKDIISEINGESAYDISTTEAVKKIRGPKGTKVKLQIIRDGRPLEFEITRDNITIPSIESEVTADGIGILKVSRFGDDTSQLARKAAAEFRSKNVKGLILDVRGNPGGLLDASVELADLWLDPGSVVLQEKRDGEVIKTYRANEPSPLKGIPTIVLIDEGSASASEIVAGALKDNGAATTLGVASYGKGSVQELRELDAGGVLKVTIARWHTPEGRNIDEEGIEPDKKVEISEEDIKSKRDPQKDAAIEQLKR